MNKLCKKIVSITAIVATSVGAVFGATGCKSKKNRADTLYIEAVQLGYGLDWLDAVAKGWAKETGNKYEIKKKVGEQGTAAIADEIESHSSTNDIFVYRTGEYARRVYEGQINVNGKKYDNVFLDLTETCNTALAGENGATIDGKLQAAYKDIYKINGKYYALPWIEGVMGIMRNVTLWNKLGLTDDDVPLTTDHMFETLDKIKQLAAANTKFKDVAPFIYSARDEYYTSFVEAWFMQYEGEAAVKNFLSGKDPSGNVSKDVFTYQGQREMLEVTEKLVKSSNKYQHPKSSGLEFTAMQGQFLKEQAVFCVNGAWIEIEQGASYPNVDVDFIDTPIISSIVKKLSFYDEEATDNESRLRELVKYIDAVESGYENKPAFASNADVDTVREARRYNYSSQGGSHILVGSSYSPKTAMIKSFVSYMYSDKGMNEYYKATKGAVLPLDLSENGSYDDIQLTSLQTKINAIDRNEVFVYGSSSKMFSIGGVSVKFDNGASNFIRSLADGTLSASGVLLNNQNYMRDNWSVISSRLR